MAENYPECTLWTSVNTHVPTSGRPLCRCATPVQGVSNRGTGREAYGSCHFYSYKPKTAAKSNVC